MPDDLIKEKTQTVFLHLNCLQFIGNKSAAGMHHTPPRNIFDTKTMHKSRAITQMKTTAIVWT